MFFYYLFLSLLFILKKFISLQMQPFEKISGSLMQFTALTHFTALVIFFFSYHELQPYLLTVPYLLTLITIFYCWSFTFLPPLCFPFIFPPQIITLFTDSS